MRIFFSVGEPSGDLHGANLIRRLQERADADGTDLQTVGFGGPKMKAAGCELQFDLTTMAVMFIAEVLKNLRLFFRLIGEADDYFAKNKVDAVVLIDYPGFNWWIAKKAKKHGIPVFYYGVPQMWAWAGWRIRKIRKYVDHVLCKLPFEVEWFQKRKCQATYVGHPYFDQLANQQYDETFMQELADQQAPLLLLLPGSRNQEVKNVLPILLKTAEIVKQRVPDCRIVVGSYNAKQQAAAQTMIDQYGVDVQAMVDRTPELMKSATLCVACSGSVSMELLHYRKPTIIVFKIKRWAMFAQAILLKTKFITLVNLIAASDIRKRTWAPYDPDAKGAEPAMMPEYLTTGDPSASVADRAILWLTKPGKLRAKIDEMDVLAKQFAIPGATNRAADYLLAELEKSAKTDAPLSISVESKQQQKPTRKSA